MGRTDDGVHCLVEDRNGVGGRVGKLGETRGLEVADEGVVATLGTTG